MLGSELARLALLLLTEGGDGVGPARVRLLVEDRLRTSELGAAALARFRAEPGEGSLGIVVSVLGDEIDRDGTFAHFLAEAVAEARGGPAEPVGPVPPAPPVPPVMPVVSPTYPKPDGRGPLPAELAGRRVWVWLLGMPSMVAAAALGVLISSIGLFGAGAVLGVVLTFGGPVASIVLAARTLRRYRDGSVLAALIVSSVLLLWILGVFLSRVV
ncbi:hypothetical protein [Streptomyces sp. NPDC094032]|uniref:hypothetical protein n=1 Tax=Streptomyces sp. NPDC094032 TaxID=3155308 RepID=UPI0033168CE5